ncbi:MAG: signal peptidase II [Candidatus Omnitrophota bacterium]|nr:signal peptidase II [Candidatus Omnitrophota bacterium]
MIAKKGVNQNNLSFNIGSLFLIILIDQVLKAFILKSLQPDHSLPIIKNIFHISLVLNKGIAFGLFKNQILFYLVLPIMAIIWLILILFFSKESKQGIDRLYYFALSLILAGAISNLIDRLRFGFVIDFLDFRIWPVFNLADCAITIGVTITILRCIRLSYK